jgi:hypothetical protein
MFFVAEMRLIRSNLKILLPADVEPKLKTQVSVDNDLAGLRDNPEFQKLIE